jgi:hypothetical protein
VSTRLATALSTTRDAVVASWSHRFDRATLRGPAAQQAREHVAIVSGLVEALAHATAAGPDQLRPGSRALRDLEKATAFVGASFAAGRAHDQVAGVPATGFEVAALLLSLRDAVLEHADIELRDAVVALFEWLTILALDAFASAGKRAATERAAEQLEAGTPVLLLTPEIPAVFLVGAPPIDVLDSVFGRAMLLVVRVDAASLVIDATGLADAGAPPVLLALERLLAHRRLGAVELVVVGLPAEASERWAGMARSQGVTVRPFERFDAALTHAAGRAGLTIIRRGS